MRKEIKIHALEKKQAIDYSPIYHIIIGEDVTIRKGEYLRFDPEAKILEMGFDANNA